MHFSSGFRPFIRILCFLLVAAALVPPAAAQSLKGYRLGPQDRLLVRVAGWDPETGAFRRWEEPSGEYGVGQDGRILLPLVGSVEVAGLTVVEVSEKLTALLQDQVGAAEPPSASVELASYRPFYILGEVERPGEYAYRPGLRAVQALALAGGLSGLSGESGGNIGEVVRAMGSIKETRHDLARLKVRVARLQAEFEDAEDFAPPAGLTHPEGPDLLDALVAQERELFDARRAATFRGLEGLADLRALLDTEIAALEAKKEGQSRQVERVRSAVGDIESLVERGLARSPALLDLQRTLFELETRQLDIETGLFRARQQVNEAERDAIDLVDRRALDASIELQRTRAEIDRLEIREATLRQILLESDASAFASLEGAPAEPSFRIHREKDGNVVVMEISLDTLIEPLDVLEIRPSEALLQ